MEKLWREIQKWAAFATYMPLGRKSLISWLQNKGVLALRKHVLYALVLQCSLGRGVM